MNKSIQKQRPPGSHWAYFTHPTITLELQAFAQPDEPDERDQPNNQTNQMSDPNVLVITAFSDTGTLTDTLFADPNPKEKLFPLVNNVPQAGLSQNGR